MPPPSLPLPTADDIPRHLRSALQCALYFATQRTPASSASPPPPPPPGGPVSTVLFKSMIETPPPLAAELARLVRAASPSQSASPRKPSAPPAPDFLAISSGDALAYYLDTFFPSVPSSTYYSIPSTQVVAASAWLKQQAASRQQSGDSAQGRGGAAHQTRGSARGRNDQTKSARGRGSDSGRGQSRTLFAPP